MRCAACAMSRSGWVIPRATQRAITSAIAAPITPASTSSHNRSRIVNTGKSVRVDEVSWTVAGLLGREAGAMLAGRLLEPLLEQEPERRDAQLAVLRSWLGENGSWDATAKVLGLHRNSVRRQINAVAELLDTDLNKAQVRAELWIALQYVEALLPAGATPDPEGAS